MTNEIMTIPELAEYLKVDKMTIYRMLWAKQIPGFRVRREWRFKKEAINQWIDQTDIKNHQENNDKFEIPIVGRIAAGEPILAEENIEGTITVDRNLIKNPKDVFALRVQGESMVKAGINDGDIVLIHQQPVAENGEMVAVVIDNEATVKRFYQEKGKIKLKPENERMKPIIVDPKDKDVRIVGKVERIIKKV